ncbi:phosphatidate cytidylyltransferase [Amnibacterium flavum]|uniref:Phosphatidate cytidylyltransferase n=1 Tax=Amnibacterium flavum TaxID=2173173 RepID=A0A2V1HU47_9MICO|nr:phosphatidate cytidylyltransferase [Amnibacterium flavum]PVZ96135.1 phosphatidate cytidylyltransferase [Amnibacterium flavum]
MADPDRPTRWHAPRNRAEFQAQLDSGKSEFEAQIRDARKQFEDAQERINARTGRNLLFAIVFGLILGLSMLFSLILVKQLFLIVAAFLITFAVLELTAALRHAGREVPRIPSVLVSVATLPIAYFLPPGGQWWAIAGAIVVVTLWRLAEHIPPSGRRPWEEVRKDLGAGIFVQLYVTFLGGFSVVLASQDRGQWWTLAFLIIVISVDVGAYASGLSFGKHPMAPRISPKKTWEGFAGSAVAAVIAGILLSVLMLQMPWWFGIIFGLVMVGTATIGDLTESLIKRDLGIKDISSWLPGHGGFLDRLDSVLPSASAAFALYLIFT